MYEYIYNVIICVLYYCDLFLKKITEVLINRFLIEKLIININLNIKSIIKHF